MDSMGPEGGKILQPISPASGHSYGKGAGHPTNWQPTATHRAGLGEARDPLEKIRGSIWQSSLTITTTPLTTLSLEILIETVPDDPKKLPI